MSSSALATSEDVAVTNQQKQPLKDEYTSQSQDALDAYNYQYNDADDSTKQEH